MPLKICYPALEYEVWRIITGSDPKNTLWSYHNGGSWPKLLWQFTLACIKMGRADLAQKAVAMAEKRLLNDRWPEYYDTRKGKFIGKQSRLFQTWTITGFLTSEMLVENPEMASFMYWEEDYKLLEICVCALNKTGRRKCSRGTAKSQILSDINRHSYIPRMRRFMEAYKAALQKGGVLRNYRFSSQIKMPHSFLRLDGAWRLSTVQRSQK